MKAVSLLLIGLGLGLCCSLVPTQAQTYSTHTYTTEDGLTDNNVLTAYEDRMGYLWVGTTHGINRFDGTSFTQFTRSDGLPDSYCNCFYEDRMGRLWVCTRRGMAEFKKDSIYTYPIEENVQITYVTSYYEKEDGKLIVNTDRGFFWFDHDRWKRYRISEILGNEAGASLHTHDGDYFIRNGRELTFIDKEQQIKSIWTAPASRNPSFSCINTFQDTTYISTYQDLYRIGRSGLEPLFQDHLQDKNLRHFWKENPHSWWISTDQDGVIHLMNTEDGIVQQEFPLPYNAWGHLFGDSQSQIWACHVFGLTKIAPSRYGSIQVEEIEADQHIRHLIALSNDTLLLSLGNGRLLLIQLHIGNQPPYQVLKEFQISGGDDFIDHYDFAQDGSLWMTTRFGQIWHLDGLSLAYKTPLIDPARREHVYDIAIHPVTGQLLIATEYILLAGNASSVDTLFDSQGHFISDPRQLFFNDTGDLLVKSGETNLFSLTYAPQNLRFHQILQRPIDYKNRVDQQGHVWIVEDGISLSRLTWSGDQFTLSDQLNSATTSMSFHIFDFLVDQKGLIWTITNLGIERISESISGQWTVDEHLINDFHYGIFPDFVHLAETDQYVWVNLRDQLIYFNKEDTISASLPHAVIIEDVQLNNQPTRWQDFTDSLVGYFQIPARLNLRHNQNTLIFNYNTPNLLSKERIVYAYRLLPSDTLWGNPSRNQSVSFNKLLPGSYTFEVKSRTPETQWSNPSRFSFAISKPFWDTYWFRFLLISSAATIILLLFRFRVKQERRKGEIKSQLLELEMRALRSQMNPHFIYNALNSIQSLVATDQTRQAGKYISMFAKLLRQVLENSQYNVISLSKELASLRLYIELEKLRMDTEVGYREIIDPEIVPESVSIPPLILQPFVENALWHGLSSKEGDKTLDLKISYAGEWIAFSIIDNGIGRKKAAQLKPQLDGHTPMAMSVTEKRIQDFNGETSHPIIFGDLMDAHGLPAGTEVSFRIRRSAVPGLVR